MFRMIFIFLFILQLFGLTKFVHASDVKPTQIHVEIVPGLQSSSELPSADLIRARKFLVKGGRLRTHQLRSLADLGDGFAAYRFAQWLDGLSDPKLLSDTAHYYGMAAATGRGSAFRKLVETLDKMDGDTLSTSRKAVLLDIVIAYAEAGNPYAVEASIRYHSSQRPFGNIQLQIGKLLLRSSGEGAAQIAASLAISLLQDSSRSPSDLKLARQYLKAASGSSSLKTLTIVSNLSPIIDDELAGSSVSLIEVSQ